MIGQYLSNTNESATVAEILKFCQLNEQEGDAALIQLIQVLSTTMNILIRPSTQGFPSKKKEGEGEDMCNRLARTSNELLCVSLQRASQLFAGCLSLLQLAIATKEARSDVTGLFQTNLCSVKIISKILTTRLQQEISTFIGNIYIPIRFHQRPFHY